MSLRICRGCGVPVQSENPEKPGYLPEILLNRPDNRNLVCRRCFRMSHYGEAGKIQPGVKSILHHIYKAIEHSDYVLLVVDFSDLAGSLPVWSDLIGNKPFLLLVNKADLIPYRANPEEILAYVQDYLRISKFTSLPEAVFLVSGLKGKLGQFVSKLKFNTASGNKIAVLGVTNAGKSSLIKSLLQNENSSQHNPTVSKYPGTTMGLSNWDIFKGRNTLVDTPGLIPGDRLGDLLCPHCASGLITTTKLEQKLWGLKQQKGLLIGDLIGIEPLGSEDVVVITFTSPFFNTHRTDNAKVRQFLSLNPAPVWLGKTCNQCRSKFEWSQLTVHLKSNQDLAIAGLGWISLRGRETDFNITLPKGVRWEIRTALIGKKE